MASGVARESSFCVCALEMTPLPPPLGCWGMCLPNPLFPILAFCADSEIQEVILQRAKTSGMRDPYLENSCLKTQVSRGKPTDSQAR